MVDTPIKKRLWRGYIWANVASSAADVEALDPRRGVRPSAAGRLALALALALAGLSGCGLSGCVETAECNDAVECPAAEVCFEYRCRRRCGDQSDCGDTQQCMSCQPADPADETDKCFGVQAHACVPETS